jgi:membrane associated rhomboid family serine protease
MEVRRRVTATRSGSEMRRTLEAQIKILGYTMIILWTVFFVTVLAGGRPLALGIIPRTTIGLRGIIFGPFLHASYAHLLTNSIGFLMLGWLVMMRDLRHFVIITFVAMLSSGIMAWLLGPSNSVHIGASGVIFGYLGFLMLSGWYTRSVGNIVLSVLVTVIWGSVVFGVLPGEAGISWQAHLGGFIGGVLAAKAYRASPATYVGFANRTG